MYGPTLEKIVEYVDGIFSIKDSANTVFIDANAVTAPSSEAVHKRLLEYLLTRPLVHNVLIFNNEISITRNLGDVTDNEIKLFLNSFVGWDILILSNYTGTDLELVPNYNIIKKSLSIVTYDSHKYVYIASQQYMQKIASNNMDSIQTYIYTYPFIESIEQTSSSITDKYLVAEVIGLMNINPAGVTYEWRGIFLP
jgi:ABC-type uncharacterized transport system permease subunit